MTLMKPSDYFPIEYLFNLLSIYRRGSSFSNRSLYAAVRRRGFWSIGDPATEGFGYISQIVFWVKLAQAAGLLSDQTIPYPTYLAYDWLCRPFINQMEHLLTAWLEIPESGKYRHKRSELLHRLAEGTYLEVRSARPLKELTALGMYTNNGLTELGSLLLSGEKHRWQIDHIPSMAWTIEADRLMIPYPPRWELLWELETYLDPSSPGIYPLTEKNLRQAVQRGAAEKKPDLVTILTIGMAEKPPFTVLQKISNQHTIRILPGPVLEFSNSKEILQLRKTRGLRKELERILSPRHVALDPWTAPSVLKKLHRKGLLSESELDLPVFFYQAVSPAYFHEGSEFKTSPADRTYLLTLHILMESLGVMTPPPDLFERLLAGLPGSSWAAAANKAYAIEDLLLTTSGWNPEEELPPEPVHEILTVLQTAIDHGLELEIMYKPSHRSSYEYRRVSPLLMENRGGRYYLLAYCHSRRANRTFRLDRLKLIGPPGNSVYE